MRNVNDFRKLVELIFMKKHATRNEILSPESSIPACLQANDFYPKLRYILFIRRLIIRSRWESVFMNIYISKILKSHQLYVTSVMKSFLDEHSCNLNVFDSFLSVCCLMYFFSEEILQCTGVDYCDLNTDIIMGFYDGTLKKFFSKRGGIQGFVEYICDHKYLAWKWDRHDLLIAGGPYSQVNRDTIVKIQKEFNKEMDYHKSIKLNKDALNASSVSLGLTVLATTSVKLPTLPNYSYLTNRIAQFRESETEESAERKRVLTIAVELEVLENLWKEFMSPDLGSTVSQNVNKNDEFARYKKIIQAVISYNSRNLDKVHLDNPILKEADETLEKLEDTIVYLIKVLDAYDKE